MPALYGQVGSGQVRYGQVRLDEVLVRSGEVRYDKEGLNMQGQVKLALKTLALIKNTFMQSRHNCSVGLYGKNFCNKGLFIAKASLLSGHFRQRYFSRGKNVFAFYDKDLTTQHRLYPCPVQNSGQSVKLVETPRPLHTLTFGQPCPDSRIEFIMFYRFYNIQTKQMIHREYNNNSKY